VPVIVWLLLLELGRLLVGHRNVAGTDVRYDMGGPAAPHPLLGRWLPGNPLIGADGPTRVADLMRHARPVLLDLTGGPSAGDPALAEMARGWSSRVELVTARCIAQPPAAALLIRPDGYAAWVGALDDPQRPVEHGLRTPSPPGSALPVDPSHAVQRTRGSQVPTSAERALWTHWYWPPPVLLRPAASLAVARNLAAELLAAEQHATTGAARDGVDLMITAGAGGTSTC
jgi:Aromatic-ring hydroxylase, C-terminal